MDSPACEGSPGYPEPGEQRFDMFEAEFGHEGERCTFEVIVRRVGLDDPALAVLGELVRRRGAQ